MSTPTFNPDGGTRFITQQRTVTVTTSTIGANMRYTINGAPPTSTTGTLISGSSGTVTVTPSPLGATLRVIAYKAGMIDSQVHEAVFYYENENGGNSNMAQPIDGGPGGGGVVIDGGDQPTISYDNNGNLIHYKEWNYRYDAQNRLTEAWNGTTTAQFYYDGKNRQIARRIGGDIRFSSWDNWELLEEYASGLTVVKGYLQGATGVIKSWDPIYGQLYFYQDKLGSTTHVANALGQLVESYHYDLTGTPSYFSSTSQPINFSTVGVADLYAGERWIPELRLYDLRNRFMSPELGRFLQPDPIGFKGDASNLYRYCGNDPVDRSDPTGLVDMFWAHQMWFQGGSAASFEQFQTAANDAARQFETRATAISKAPDGAKVEWQARVVGVGEDGASFKKGQAATADWKVESTITRDASGKVASIKNDLQITVHFNVAKIDSAEFAKYTKAFFDRGTGEFAHVADAFRYATRGGEDQYGHFNSAIKIANESSRDLTGMKSSLQEWTTRSMKASHNEWDTKPYWPTMGIYGHLFGL